MSKVHFTTIGAKLSGPGPHPLFIIDRIYPAKFIHLILSDEPDSSEKESVDQNLSEIISALEMTGMKYQIHKLKLEDFWHNVATIAEMIASTEIDDEVVLNFSTGRRVFVSAMVMAGTLVKSWLPDKNIICVQTSRERKDIVTFEPNPMIPDNYDRIILNQINTDEKSTTTKIAGDIDKRQSTVSTRLKKLNEADYIELQGHTKILRPKGEAFLNLMNNLAKMKVEAFDEKAIKEKKQVWKKHRQLAIERKAREEQQKKKNKF